MQYVTHQFAHLETLMRARRWLVQLGFDPSHIEVSTAGAPRIAVLVDSGRRMEVEMVLDAAEMADPDGWPGFWDMGRFENVNPSPVETVAVVDQNPKHSDPISWHPPDRDTAVEPGFEYFTVIASRWD
jgi:hypothetical protein